MSKVIVLGFPRSGPPLIVSLEIDAHDSSSHFWRLDFDAEASREERC
jgi:hypothetical protein